MYELEFDAAESADLLELIEGEGSCSLVLDAVARLYDELASSAQPRGCVWHLSERERREIVPELEECAETIEWIVLDRLVARLHTLPVSDSEAGARTGN